MYYLPKFLTLNTWINFREKELNEMRHRAGLDTVSNYNEPDRELKAFISMAGL